MGEKNMRQHYVSKAIVGGLLGTLLQTVVVYGMAPIMAGQAMDVAALLAHSCSPTLLVHILSGSVIFSLGYAWLSSQSLSTPPVMQGMLWGGLIWFVAEVVIAPMLGAEIFSAALGGLPAAMRALLGYLVYGATLGAIVGTVQLEGRYATVPCK
jgi:uncharacterized membrane protein YagU involved in acid resistance